MLGRAIHYVGSCCEYNAYLFSPLLSVEAEIMAQAKTLTVSANAFGVPGMTTGAVGIMTMILFGIVSWYIRGMADRKRADNENVTSLSTAHDLLFRNMQTEIGRLSRLVIDLSARITELERELHEARKNELGSIRNSAQATLSTNSLLGKKDNGTV